MKLFKNVPGTRFRGPFVFLRPLNRVEPLWNVRNSANLTGFESNFTHKTFPLPRKQATTLAQGTQLQVPVAQAFHVWEVFFCQPTVPEKKHPHQLWGLRFWFPSTTNVSVRFSVNSQQLLWCDKSDSQKQNWFAVNEWFHIFTGKRSRRALAHKHNFSRQKHNSRRKRTLASHWQLAGNKSECKKSGNRHCALFVKVKHQTKPKWFIESKRLSLLPSLLHCAAWHNFLHQS